MLRILLLLLLGMLLLPTPHSHAADTRPLFALAEPPHAAFPRKDPPKRFKLERVFASLSFVQPVFLTSAKDGSGRLFVVEKGGRIQVILDSSTAPRAETFLSIENQVGSEVWEEGLLGLAFDPSFKQNHSFYIVFSTPPPRRAIIRRYQVSRDNPHRADPASAEDILSVPLQDPTHIGGMLAFGPDGMLYASFGDSTEPDKEWRVKAPGSSLNGSIIRIDPHHGPSHYGIPPDNPFVGNPWHIREEIWAYGLRSPWRFSFVPNTQDLLVGDAGNHRREEVNLVRKGQNYGWPFREGSLAYDIPLDPDQASPPQRPLPQHPPRDPVFEYGHEVGLCIIGGFIYRGSLAPSLKGKYIYGDFSVLPRQAPIWALSLDLANGRALKNEEIARFSKLVSFGEDEQGELYAISLGNAGIARLVEEHVSGSEDKAPTRLSQTGLFTSLRPLQPAPDLIPYEINRSFWSDGAEKKRWFVLPDQGKLSFQPETSWEFPVGSKIIKHFDAPMAGGQRHPIETRVLSLQEDGWRGFTYAWNTTGDEAFLLATAKTIPWPGETKTGKQWFFPGPHDCFSCHTQESGVLLGLRTPQLHGANAGHELIATWERRGLFQNHPHDESWRQQAHFHAPGTAPSLAEEAREYLDVNCAPCHRPGVLSQSHMDLRYATPWPQKNIIGLAPKLGDLGIKEAQIVYPGRPDKSVLLTRMRRHDSYRMPPLGSLTVDQAGEAAIRAWIQSLGGG